MENDADPAQNVEAKQETRVDTIKACLALLRGAMVLSGFGVSHTECGTTRGLWLQLVCGLGIKGKLSEALTNGIPKRREFQLPLLRKLVGEHIVPLSVDESQSENIRASTKMLYQRYNCSSQKCAAKLVAAMFNEIASLQGSDKCITEDDVKLCLASFQNGSTKKGTGKTEDFPRLIEKRGIMIRSNFHSQQTPIFYSAKPSEVVPRNELQPVQDEAKKRELAAYRLASGPQMRSEDVDDDDKSKLPYSRGRSGKRSAADRSDDEEYARRMDMMSKGSWAQQSFPGRPPSKVAKNEMKADKEAWTIGPWTSNPDLDLPQGNDNTTAHQSLPPFFTNEGSVSGLSPPNPPGMDCEQDIPASEDEELASELQEAENAPESIGKVLEEPRLLDDEEEEYMDSEFTDEIKNLDPKNLEASVKVQLQFKHYQTQTANRNQRSPPTSLSTTQTDKRASIPLRW